jgi:hypothetical protein
MVAEPSMKLQAKERTGSKLRRTYDQAQTPMQRLSASGTLAAQKQQELLRITEALDPLRLLAQLEQLQKARLPARSHTHIRRAGSAHSPSVLGEPVY